MERKDADNSWKVICKSSIQWFQEINLGSYKFVLIHPLFFVAVEVEFLEYNKITHGKSLRKPVILVFPRVLMFPSTSPQETSVFSQKEKNCCPPDLTRKHNMQQTCQQYHYVRKTSLFFHYSMIACIAKIPLFNCTCKHKQVNW